MITIKASTFLSESLPLFFDRIAPAVQNALSSLALEGAGVLYLRNIFFNVGKACRHWRSLEGSSKKSIKFRNCPTLGRGRLKIENTITMLMFILGWQYRCGWKAVGRFQFVKFLSQETTCFFFTRCIFHPLSLVGGMAYSSKYKFPFKPNGCKSVQQIQSQQYSKYLYYTITSFQCYSGNFEPTESTI